MDVTAVPPCKRINTYIDENGEEVLLSDEDLQIGPEFATGDDDEGADDSH